MSKKCHSKRFFIIRDKVCISNRREAEKSGPNGGWGSGNKVNNIESNEPEGTNETNGERQTGEINDPPSFLPSFAPPFLGTFSATCKLCGRRRKATPIGSKFHDLSLAGEAHVRLVSNGVAVTKFLHLLGTLMNSEPELELHFRHTFK